MNIQQLVRVATLVMNDLEKEIGQTLGFGRLSFSDRVPMVEVLVEVEGTAGFCFRMNPGLKIPMHTSAPGKAILGSMPIDECNGLLEQMPFERFTEYTIISADAFNTELDCVRECGYATDMNEQVLNCHCVGVPVRIPDDEMVCALWTTGLADSIPEDRFTMIAASLIAGSREIEASIQDGSRKMNAEYANLVMERAIREIDSTLDRSIDMKQLAASLFVSYSWFRQTFKRRTGVSPNHYHMERRMDKAKALLSSSGMLIKEVSDQLGFVDQAYFSAHFKRKTGQSPQAFRESQ